MLNLTFLVECNLFFKTVWDVKVPLLERKMDLLWQTLLVSLFILYLLILPFAYTCIENQ